MTEESIVARIIREKNLGIPKREDLEVIVKEVVENNLELAKNPKTIGKIIRLVFDKCPGAEATTIIEIVKEITP